ncbi:MAG TPA: radical SAM protein, partial [Acidilobales archaeon]|nr:radical SAM protein [Acidilobales archaeon]
MGKCKLCGLHSKVVSDVIGVCTECLRRRPREALKIALRAHLKYRVRLGLPPRPPKPPLKTDGIVRCSLCVNECAIPPNGKGFCGLWFNDGGRLRPIVGHNNAVVLWYLDPLPTNCVATPVCPAASEVGYPDYSPVKGPEYGYYNLAVFFAGCSLDCIFCQNWEHKDMISNDKLRAKYLRSLNDLVESAISDDRITCVCYFGGDPGPHAIYAINASRKILEYARKKGAIKRICWETNGLENPAMMREMARLSLESGGIVKVDWKAWTPSIYEALTG